MRQRLGLALSTLAVGLVLAGCTITFRPGGAPVSVHAPGVVVWAQLGLRIELPGLVIVERHAGPHHLDTVFDSDASLGRVYGDVDGRMRSQGWRREHYEEHHGKVVAVYGRDGRRAHVTVMAQGRSGRYRLTIDD